MIFDITIERYVMKIFLQRVAAAMIVFALMIAFVPPAAFAEGSDTGQDRAMSKINELVGLLDGTYFTTDRKKCTSNGSTRCLNTEVVKCSWFEELFGYTVKASQLAYQYRPDGVLGPSGGYSCYGFANFAMWYVFAESNTAIVGSKVTKVSAGKSPKFDYATLSSYARPGDIIRIRDHRYSASSSNGHSVMFVSCDKSGVTVLDSNYVDDNLVKLHTITYSSKYGGRAVSNCSVTITRASNYDTVTGGTTYAGTPEGAEHSKIEFSDVASPTVLHEGEAFGLSGKISSYFLLDSVKCEIIDAGTGEAYDEYTEHLVTKTLDIAKSNINYLIKFGNLPTGTYRMKLTATDIKKTVAEWTSLDFSVVGAEHECVFEISKMTPIENSEESEILCTCLLCGAQKLEIKKPHEVEICPVIIAEDARLFAGESVEISITAGASNLETLEFTLDAPEGFTLSEKAVTVKFEPAADVKKQVIKLLVTVDKSIPPGEYEITPVCDGSFTVPAKITVKQVIVGDMNADGELNAEDSIYLLYHVYFKSDYPIHYPADCDGDGEENSGDAIYLLYHVYFRNDYPLYPEKNTQGE